MENLDLKKLWNVCNTLSEKGSELCEQNIYVHLLGHRSNYGEMGFEGFLNYYSFRVDGDEIMVFNNDGVPYESYTNEDFSYIPLSLLSFDAERLESWVEIEIDLQLKRQERDKLAEKENIKQKIKYLETQLNNL
jgi:hypothetical protein